MHDFAAFLLDPAELNPRLNIFRTQSHFFFKFDLGSRQEIFSRSRFTLWDCPCAVVFVDVEGSAGMRQQNFQFVFPAPEHQQTSADSTSLRFSVVRHYFAPAAFVTGSL